MIVNSCSAQRGATLIVALVILAVVTVVGIASMRGTNLEMKMIASARDRALAFEAAEATLSIVEDNIKAEFSTVLPKDFYKNHIQNVYTESCGSGKCFSGVIGDQNSPYRTCSTFKAGSTSAEPWAIGGNWGDATKHQTEPVKLQVSLNDGVGGVKEATITTSYMVEFMCFALKDNSFKGKIDDKQAGNERLIYMPLFRITAVAKGLGERAEVAAQSMFKVQLGS